MPEYDLKENAAWIAEQMGWGTLDVQSSYNHVLTKTENDVEMKLWLSVESGRLRIHADSMGLYEFLWREERFPSITCSLAKTPPRIARDIERRVLPEYRLLLEKVLTRKAAHDERKRQQHECCQQIADLLGAEVRDGQGRDGDPRVYCYGKGTAAIEFIVSSDTSVHIEIRGASFQAAMHIAHTTQEWLRYGWNKDNEQAMLEREQEESK
jgi:hypothetical protein